MRAFVKSAIRMVSVIVTATSTAIGPPTFAETLIEGIAMCMIELPAHCTSSPVGNVMFASPTSASFHLKRKGVSR